MLTHYGMIACLLMSPCIVSAPALMVPCLKLMVPALIALVCADRETRPYCAYQFFVSKYVGGSEIKLQIREVVLFYIDRMGDSIAVALMSFPWTWTSYGKPEDWQIVKCEAQCRNGLPEMPKMPKITTVGEFRCLSVYQDRWRVRLLDERSVYVIIQLRRINRISQEDFENALQYRRARPGFDLEQSRATSEIARAKAIALHSELTADVGGEQMKGMNRQIRDTRDQRKLYVKLLRERRKMLKQERTNAIGQYLQDKRNEGFDAVFVEDQLFLFNDPSFLMI